MHATRAGNRSSSGTATITHRAPVACKLRTPYAHKTHIRVCHSCNNSERGISTLPSFCLPRRSFQRSRKLRFRISLFSFVLQQLSHLGKGGTRGMLNVLNILRVCHSSNAFTCHGEAHRRSRVGNPLPQAIHPESLSFRPMGKIYPSNPSS